MPIFTFVNPSINDQLNWNGCPYAIRTTDSRRNSDLTYIDYWWIMNFSREPLARALALNDIIMAEADWTDVYHYGDAWVAR